MSIQLQFDFKSLNGSFNTVIYERTIILTDSNHASLK